MPAKVKPLFSPDDPLAGIMDIAPKTAASYQAFDGARRAQEILEAWKALKPTMDEIEANRE